MPDRPVSIKRPESWKEHSAMRLTNLALAALAAFWTTAAGAESPMPEEIAWKLLEIGSVVEVPNTALLYTPLQQKETYPDVKIDRDIKYGPADRNLLDLFTPATRSSVRPVLIFVHAGGFVGGDKRTDDSPFYDNVALWAVKNGFLGINVTYRLAPQAGWPAGAEDLASAVQWITDNIGDRGGDARRIYLMGHSAGAVHVASYVSHPEFHKVKGGGLAGAILLFRIYHLTPPPAGAPQIAYFCAHPPRPARRTSRPGRFAPKTPPLAPP